MSKPANKQKTLTLLAIAVILVAGGAYAWKQWQASHVDLGLASGNGRIEATEIDVATKLGGRVEEILVSEGSFVKSGEPLARMQILSLQAQQKEALAGKDRAVHTVAAAKAQVALRESDHAAALAQVAQRESELDNAQRRLARSETLTKEGASSAQELDDDRARVRGAQAALKATQAQAAAAKAAIAAAQAEVTGSDSSVAAAMATVQRIDVELQDSTLTAPRDGRVQFRLAQPGEVLGAGGKVLTFIDLSDVYMTIFLPAADAGRIGVGTPARLLLEPLPDRAVPAAVSFVSARAQFTPKQVETQRERDRMMFRVKLRVARPLVEKYLEQVKTGVTGVGYVRLDPAAQWPAWLDSDLVQEFGEPGKDTGAKDTGAKK